MAEYYSSHDRLAPARHERLWCLWQGPVIPPPASIPWRGKDHQRARSQTLCPMIDSAVVSNLAERGSHSLPSQRCLTVHCERKALNLCLPFLILDVVLFVSQFLFACFSQRCFQQHKVLYSSNLWLGADFASAISRLYLAGPPSPQHASNITSRKRHLRRKCPRCYFFQHRWFLKYSWSY